jgi:hypothetical protein
MQGVILIVTFLKITGKKLLERIDVVQSGCN